MAASRVRVIQTNSAGDNVHIIDPATNKVAGVIEGIDVPHGVAIAPDGSRIYITEEPTKTVDVVDSKSLKVIKKIPLSGRPNNLAVSKDGRRVYIGIAQAPGAVDVVDTVSLTNIRTVPVDGAIHNVYVTPDGRYAVSGSIAKSTISVIDTETDKVAWSVKLSSGIRPMAFTKNIDGSTKEIIVQLSDFHGLVVVDFRSHKEINRITLPDLPGKERETDGIQGSPAHGQGERGQLRFCQVRVRSCRALQGTNAVSKQNTTRRKSPWLSPRLTFGEGKANVDNAKLNLEYCTIRSPLEGRTGMRHGRSGQHRQSQ